MQLLVDCIITLYSIPNNPQVLKKDLLMIGHVKGDIKEQTPSRIDAFVLNISDIDSAWLSN